MITICGGQGQVAVPDPTFDLGSRCSRGELEVAELPSGLEAGIHEIVVHRHRLERADDLVPGATLGSPLAGDGSQPEQVVEQEEIAAQSHHVAVVEDKTFLRAGAAELHERASGGGLAHGAMLTGLHRAPGRVSGGQCGQRPAT